MKVVAVIPCFDEELFIGDLVSQLRQFVDLVIVADDCSSDRTVDVARNAGAWVVRHFDRCGFGANTRSGMSMASSIGGCEIIVTLDGDAQHMPSEVKSIIEPIEKGEADIVIGSRFLKRNGSIPNYRKVGIRIITWIYNLFNSQKITDSQCCFRAYRTDVIRGLKCKEDGFTFSTEILVRARALGCRIREVPCTVIYHKKFCENSTLNPIIHGMGVALGTVKVRLQVEVLDKIFGGNRR